MESGKVNGKIIFADQLRSLAIISVIIAHWWGVFWENRWMVVSLTQSPYLNMPTPSFVAAIKDTIPFFNFGQFGVALFFLISGFVIPLSLERKTNSGFLKSRFMRIFPTYIASSLLTIGIVSFLTHYYWDSNVDYNWAKVFYNLTLTNSIFDILSFDSVNWTLSVEVKFYLLCAILSRLIINGRILVLIAIPSIILLFTFLLRDFLPVYKFGGVRFSLFNIKMELMFIGFMFAGIAFSFHFKKIISTPALTFLVLGICGITMVSWYIGPIKDQFPSSPASFIYATVTFSLCYYMRSHFKEIKAISFLSGISYPLYITHSVIGYAILRILLDLNMSISKSMFITSLCVLMITTTLHYTIERYSINKGKKYK